LRKSDLKGKVAVVTGASKGIGAAIAKGLSAAGAAVVVNYSSSKEGADRAVVTAKCSQLAGPDLADWRDNWGRTPAPDLQANRSARILRQHATA